MMTNNGDTRIVRMLLTMFKVKIYPKNSLIAEEGDVPSHITLLMKGEAKVYRKL